MNLSYRRKNDRSMKRKQSNKWEEEKKVQFGIIFLKNFFLLFVCMLIPLVFVNIWYNNYLSARLNDRVRIQNEQEVQDFYDKFEAVVEAVRDMAAGICWDKSVRYLTVQSNLRTKRAEVENVISLLKTYGKSSEYIESVCIYFVKEDCFITETELKSYEQYSDRECVVLYKNGKGFRESPTVREKSNYYPYVLTIVEPVKIDNENVLAMVIVNIDVERLGEYFGTGGYQKGRGSSFLIIMDEAEKTFVYSDEYLLYRETNAYEDLHQKIPEEKRFSSDTSLWGNDYLVSGFRPKNHILYLKFSPMEQWLAELQRADNVFRAVVLICIVACLFVTYFLSVWLYRPVRRTINALKESKLLQDKRGDYRDELEIICYSIETVKEERDIMSVNIAQKVSELQKMQLCALQGQINPHFLYNTLDAIGNASALLLDEENMVTEMIYALGKLMRISLSKKTFLVKLSEEIEHIKLYIQLLDFRYRGEVKVHLANLEEQYEEKIIKLTLQPLVENAVQHGILKKERMQGNIWIRGEKRGMDNYICVIDDGEQVDDARLGRVRKMLKDDSLDCVEHIGLKNVEQRIRNLYGEDCGLEVSKAKEGGMCVTVHYKTLG